MKQGRQVSKPGPRCQTALGPWAVILTFVLRVHHAFMSVFITMVSVTEKNTQLNLLLLNRKTHATKWHISSHFPADPLSTLVPSIVKKNVHERPARFLPLRPAAVFTLRSQTHHCFSPCNNRCYRGRSRWNQIGRTVRDVT